MKIADYEVPEDLYYDDYHFWCRPEGDEVVIGMDDFAQRLAGDIVFVQLPFVGKAVTRGKKLSKVESGKWLGTVYGPADGEITAVNEELEENPGRGLLRQGLDVPHAPGRHGADRIPAPRWQGRPRALDHAGRGNVQAGLAP